MTQEIAIEAGALPQFSVARVLSTSFSVLSRNFLPFLVVAFTISIPYILIQTMIDWRSDQGGSVGGGYSAGSYLQMVTFSLVQAALAYGTFQDLHGRRAAIGDCFRQGLAHSGKLLGAAFLYSLLILLALVALVVPAIVLYVMWWVYVPAITVEGLSPTASFRRSKQLTAGRRWAILGLSLLVLVVFAAVAIGAVLLIALVPGINPIVGDIAATLMAVLFTLFSGVMSAVGYFYLRAEKEGIAIDDIARVFD